MLDGKRWALAQECVCRAAGMRGCEMKLGKHKILKNGDSIREIWLTKWKPTKEYQIWGSDRNAAAGKIRLHFLFIFSFCT